MSRTNEGFRPWDERGHDGPHRIEENMMAKVPVAQALPRRPDDRALELAGELSAAPGAGGRPIHEWLEVRPFLTAPPTVTE